MTFTWLKTFAETNDARTTSLLGLNSRDRAIVHKMAEAFGFEHQSVGRGKSRQVLITVCCCRGRLLVVLAFAVHFLHLFFFFKS